MRPCNFRVCVHLVSYYQGCGNPGLEGHNQTGFSDLLGEHLFPTCCFCLGGQKTRQDRGHRELGSALNSSFFTVLLLFFSCRYQLLHVNVQSSLFVTETPERVGTLLDYQLGRLSFYNAQSGQLLGAFCQQFAQPCHPALGLEMPGSLEVSMVLEMPDFLKNS